MRKTVQILLFIISYAPLYLILLFQNFNDDFFDKEKHLFIGIEAALRLNAISIGLFILIILSISMYFLFFKIVLKSAGEMFVVTEIKDNHAEHLSYLATYILPFIGLKFSSWQNLIATVALFYVLGHIYIQTNLILTNPTLTFFKYSISRIVDNHGLTKILIHKGKIIKEKELEFISLIDNIYILKNGKKPNSKST